MHAAYRGHLTTASLDDLTTDGNPGDALVGRAHSEAQYIHKTLAPGEKAIVVTLGSVQGGHDRKTLNLRSRSGLANNARLASHYLEILIHGADCGSKIVQLPLWADYSADPLVGRLGLDAPSQVTVRLWHGQGTPASRNTLVSSGTVFLGDDFARFGASRESMLRETTVVLLDKETMGFAGTVLLSYVIAKPFEGLADGEPASYTRKPGDPVWLVGHRGLGQNTAGKSNLQIGENTVTPTDLEPHVQLTRDLEAVIYHDFSLSGSGSDVPIHDISLAQYKYAGDMQNPLGGALLLESGGGGGTGRPRASSTGEHSVLKAMQAQERLRYTVDFDGKGFKANIRGHSIQDAHATLEELLATLPEEIGFNIEMKYQRLHEAVEAGVASVTIDINTFVDVALEKLRRLAGRRPILLSSFTPEVCILLRLKQSAYPVLLISNAGKLPRADKEVRAASLQSGLQFARYWRLSGLVLACDVFLLCPRLISLVKSAGLVCASYGLGNNDPENVKMQAEAGIDILIVDKVKLVADALGKLPSPTE
ncbi:ankyrin repeat-containing protein, putative [Cordyceps militaris CM01]|uniref:Ankyrin repeat-containing protein, putative n=1 Tax=Cordyceps militaris (strain CM01) TaxID=983644 RepID=G3JRP6_CORMM|nr:ankyrin repeat-containing protein, putative [Cordyceps militaris CM01]EGX88436.1 ankyrin repeat-containing protein, putative [Cordyceps militaris CM01]